MTLSGLVLQLSKSELAPAPILYAQAWRILNDYSENLRSAAEAWAEKRALPEVEADGLTLQQVMDRTGATVPQALELMYVLEEDPEQGRFLITRCTRRDRLR